MSCKIATHFLLEKRRFWTKIRDFAARFSFEKRRFWTKIRENPFAEILISSTQTGDLTSNTLNLSNWTTVQLLIWKYSKKYCNGATNQHRFCGLYPTARNHSMTVIRMIRLMIWLWAVESWHHRRQTRNFKVWQRPIMRFATDGLRFLLRYDFLRTCGRSSSPRDEAFMRPLPPLFQCWTWCAGASCAWKSRRKPTSTQNFESGPNIEREGVGASRGSKCSL